MRTPPWLVTALGLLAGLCITVTVMSADDDAAAPGATPADGGVEATDEETSITILYTIKNSGYIEPCG